MNKLQLYFYKILNSLVSNSTVRLKLGSNFTDEHYDVYLEYSNINGHKFSIIEVYSEDEKLEIICFYVDNLG